MRRRENVALLLVPLAVLWSGATGARAQESAQPSQLPRPLTLGYSGPASVKPGDPSPDARAPEAGDGRASRTPVRLDARDLRSRSALARLANPFDGGTLPSPYGLRVRPKASSGSGPMASAAGSGPTLADGRQGSSATPHPSDTGIGQRPRGPSQQASPQVVPALPGQAEPGGVPGTAVGADAGPTPGAPTPGLEASTPATLGPAAVGTFGEAGTGAGVGFGGTLEAGSTPFAMIGDLSPVSLRNLAPTIPSTTNPPVRFLPPHDRLASPVLAAVRGFKIADNQSPRPQDRIYFNFNYFNNLGDTLNTRFGAPVTQLKAYVYTFGVEKTFNQGMGSIGLRLPIDNLTGNSYGNMFGIPTSTALGNLTIYAKYLLAQNPRTGSLISACWAITPQTATSRFAGAPYIAPLTTTYFQACIAFIYNYNRWYFQGFNGFNFSINPNDVTLYYGDVGVGYYVYRDPAPQAWLTAVAPTFEVHVDSPLNHRDWFNRADRAGSPDNVDLTFGLNFGFRNSAILSAAFVAPVAAPRPFDSEAVLMLNILFGRSRRTLPITPPPL